MNNTSYPRCEDFQIQLLPSIYGIEFFVALVGNVFALWLLLTKERRNWHTGVVLSCNLAISDLLYVLTLPLLIVYYIQKKHWPFGNAACKIERFLFTCNLYVSIFFTTFIGVNRYVAIVHPFFYRTYVRPTHVKAISLIIWISVSAISSPVLKFACTTQHGNMTSCYSHCGIAVDGMSHLTYKLFLTVFGCLVPFLVTFASYCAVIRVVWKNANITTLEKRKVAIMVLSGLLLYAVSFVPYHVFQSYNFYLQSINKFDCSIYKAYQVSKGLATLNMCIHPLLYMAVFDSIRLACCERSQDD